MAKKSSGVAVVALALALGGSAMADIYSESFNATVLGASLGTTGNAPASAQCAHL